MDSIELLTDPNFNNQEYDLVVLFSICLIDMMNRENTINEIKTLWSYKI